MVAARLKGKGKGFTISYLSKIENEVKGFERPSDPAIVALGEVLDADADELLILAGRPPIGLGETLAKNLKARAFFKFAIARLSPEDWQELLSQVQKKKS